MKPIKADDIPKNTWFCLYIKVGDHPADIVGYSKLRWIGKFTTEFTSKDALFAAKDRVAVSITKETTLELKYNRYIQMTKDDTDTDEYAFFLLDETELAYHILIDQI